MVATFGSGCCLARPLVAKFGVCGIVTGLTAGDTDLERRLIFISNRLGCLLSDPAVDDPSVEEAVLLLAAEVSTDRWRLLDLCSVEKLNGLT